MLLPKEISAFEQSYLTRMNNIGVICFALHLPVLVAIAYLNDTGPLLAFVLTLATLAGPLMALKCWDSKRAISVVLGITAMFMGGLLVHFGQGPVQIEMHFYFFVLIALLAVFANPMVITAAAVTAALHHVVLWIALPASIFNYEAPFWVVAVHALFVVLESVAACFIARSFFDNVIGLEKIVAQRTLEVDQRNNDMRRILNSVRQGFCTISPEGLISEERSAAVDALLGKISDNETIIDVLRRHDEETAEWYELGLEDVFADIMPLQITLDQLPKRILANGKTISIASRPIHEDDKLIGLALVLTDISAEVEREKLEEDSREMVCIVEQCARDRIGFLTFFQECNNLIGAMSNPDASDLTVLKRNLHTLKGNSAIYGIVRLSRACHELEDFLAENKTMPDDKLWQKLFKTWDVARENMLTVIGEPSFSIEIPESEITGLLNDILEDKPRDVVALQVASWKLEPTSLSLRRVADQVKNLAQRMGKGNVEVKMLDNKLRLDSSKWSEFWSSFVHVVRNAVDHGLEPTEARIDSGKPANGQIVLQTQITNKQFEISISDDGRGIDWDKVTEVAYAKGLPAETHSDLVEALFTDGLSTSDSVTETSGRGVGMSAVKQAADQLGGTIGVNSELGRGTTFKFRFPISNMAPSMLENLSSKNIAKPERSLCVSPLGSSCALSNL